ncbi:MAG TPA: hypothetical protein V6C88_20870 [Chroococcidiopsis sp.]
MSSTLPSQNHSRQSWLWSAAIAVLCVGAIAALQVPQLQTLKNRSKTEALQDIRRDLEAQAIQLQLLQKVPTFGYDNLLADWVFLNFLQYFGDTAIRDRTDYSLSPNFFAVIIPRNPYFIDAYTFLSTSTALYAGKPEQSIAITSQGLAALSPKISGAYFVWRNRGIDQLLFLGDAEAARKSFEIAAEWADQSTDPGHENVAAFSRQTAQFLATNPNSKTAQVAAWTMVLSNAPDDRTRNTAIAHIRQLGGDLVTNADGSFQVVPPAQD